MRNTTFTSVLTLAAMPALAADAPEGCFSRVYDDAHLTRNPVQVVREISVAFGDFGGDTVPWVGVQVTTADREQVRRDGMADSLLSQIARCTESAVPGGWTCSVECDGGSMDILRLDAEALVFRTRSFMMNTGDDCGGNVDLAEVPDTFVSYRLNRQPDAACAGRW